MALDYEQETRSHQDQIIILASANTDTSKYLSDQNVAGIGTNRRSEIIGIAGDTGQTYSKIYNDYIDTL